MRNEIKEKKKYSETWSNEFSKPLDNQIHSNKSLNDHNGQSMFNVRLFSSTSTQSNTMAESASSLQNNI